MRVICAGGRPSGAEKQPRKAGDRGEVSSTGAQQSANYREVNDVTQILHEAEQGDAAAAEKLLPMVYNELRKLAAQRMAHETPGHTLQPTALVHEAWLRLL